MTIKECTNESYYEMREVLPPEVWTGKGFLAGEPHDFRKCSATTLLLPTYAGFFFYDRRFFESDPLTRPEFNCFTRIKEGVKTPALAAQW